MGCGDLSHVDKHVYVVIISLHILVFYQPFYLFFDKFLARKELILEDIHQFSLRKKNTMR